MSSISDNGLCPKDKSCKAGRHSDIPCTFDMLQSYNDKLVILAKLSRGCFCKISMDPKNSDFLFDKWSVVNGPFSSFSSCMLLGSRSFKMSGILRKSFFTNMIDVVLVFAYVLLLLLVAC